MPRRYKRKRLAEEWARDGKPKSYGNYFNKSERQEAKRDISKELHESPDIRELRHQIEQELASKCRNAHKACICPDPYSWSDEEVLKYLGLV